MASATQPGYKAIVQGWWALGEGNIAITYSIANFPTLCCLEQIRNDLCYHNASVKIVIIGGGLAYGPLGVSHQATEDIAVMRALPNMVVFCPCGKYWPSWRTSRGPETDRSLSAPRA